MNKQELIERYSEPIKVGSDGFVRLVDVMGDDAAIVQAARTSYGSGTKAVNEDAGLIRYLMRHWHTTPFEMCEIKLHVRVPMDTWRQWIRHRTASVNEYSTRYSLAIDSRETTRPDQWRLQSTNNKQGSSGKLAEQSESTIAGLQLTDNEGTVTPTVVSGQESAEQLSLREAQLHKLSNDVYQERIDVGVAREQARKDLPLSTYTEAYWKVDLHNLFHFLRLRLDSHAQQEIREFADAIYQIVKDWVPVAAQAFEDYRLNAVQFSGPEMKLLRDLLAENVDYFNAHPELRKSLFDEFEINNTRERAEFWKKIGREDD